MFKWKTKKSSTVRLIKVGITNCYFIEINKQTLLIDTGQKRKFDKLKTFLHSSLTEQNLQLDYLIFTHTHYDHTQNAYQIKQLYSPKVVVNNKEAGFLKSGFTSLPKGTNFITNFISSMGNKYASRIGKYDPVNADIVIDNSTQEIGIDGLKIIETPGHTVGSISVIIDDEIAIVGDTLFGIFPNKILPPFADDKNELIRSWKKLLETKCRLFLPAHGKRIKRELIENELTKIE